jgi:uncharacterized protein YfaS (alpha-2-macroglobulin family)
MKLPAMLAEGDSVSARALVFNYTGKKQNAMITLNVDFGLKKFSETKNVELDDKAVAEVEFLVKVPEGKDFQAIPSAKFELAGDAGGLKDEFEKDVNLVPWGTEFRKGLGGVAASDQAIELALPEKEYSSFSMKVTVGPSVERSFIDSALSMFPDDDYYGCSMRFGSPVSEGLIALEVMGYLKATGGTNTAEWNALSVKVQSVIAHLTVTQNGDGGWPWATRYIEDRKVGGGSNEHVTAQAMRLLAGAKRLGFYCPEKTIGAVVAFLRKVHGEASSSETKAVALYALSFEDKADFAVVNRLYRDRNSLSPIAASLLSLTLSNLGRKDTATEVSALLEKDGIFTVQPWDGEKNQERISMWADDDVERVALCTLAIARTRPASKYVKKGVDWLMEHRWHNRWASPKGSASAAAAMSFYLSTVKRASQNYTLDVSVNGTSVQREILDREARRPGRARQVRQEQGRV